MSTARLTITGTGTRPRRLELQGEIVVGRSAKSDIHIDGDLVSRHHARVYPQGECWWFEDLGSRNGTLLNGVRTQSAQLRTGDVLMIGCEKIVFEEERPPSANFEVSLVDAPDAVASAVLAQDDSRDAAGDTVALSYKDLVLVNQRVTTIARISQRLATLLDREVLLDEVLATLFELFPQADRGCIVLREEEEVFRVASTRERDGGGATTSVLGISKGLIDLVRRERKSVLSADTAHDARFAGRESVVAGGGRSLMVAPLQYEQAFFGVVYLDTRSLAKPFQSADLNLLQGVAGPVAVSLKNSQLVSRIERETQLRTSLSRYLSPDIVRQIQEGTLRPDLGGSLAEGTVMFSDIVGFTALSERLAPTDVVERLNRYFTSMLAAIFGWSGTVDKFGGDAVLAVWGAPVPLAEHAAMAVGGALEMHARLFALNLALEEAGEPRIRMAVGLNSGRFVAGNIGGAGRVEWTVIGDAVNLAQRVESLGFRGCVLVSDSTFAQLAAAGAYAFPPVHVKNRVEPVTTHSVRVLRAPRGVVAAVPGEIRLATAEPARGMVARVALRDDTRVVTLISSVQPALGEALTFAARLPEHPAELTLRGRVVSDSPLLDSRTGRSLEVAVDAADPEMARLLDCAGSAPSPMRLEQIER